MVVGFPKKLSPSPLNVVLPSPRQVVSFNRKIQPHVFGKLEFLDQAHIPVKEALIASGIARNQNAVDHGPVIILVAVVVEVRSDYISAGRAGVRHQQTAERESVAQIEQDVHVAAMPDVVLGPGGVRSSSCKYSACTGD